MFASRAPRRVALVVAAMVSTALIGGLDQAGHAAAGVPSLQSATQVTVFLRPPDLRALDRLAHDHSLGTRARLTELRSLLPSGAQHRAAARALRARGFVVVGESSWSVTATAPSGTVAATFGSRPTLGRSPTAARRRAAVGALPDLPSDLRSVAVAAFPTTGGPAAFHPRTTKSGADFRNAYTSAARTKAGQAPYDGSGTKLTIATLQFDGWNSRDLAKYAAAHGISYGPSTLTQVPVDQATVPTSSTDNNDVEVDLDQESILSTDPFAHQRAYFAPNTAAGFADGLSQVLDDVVPNSSAYQGGDPSIAALSISWGGCERLTGTAEIQTLEPILTSLVAAGVTVFSSSGDDGAYDCGPRTKGETEAEAETEAVDYPASSPEVVAVGGTHLTTTDGAPNTGSNWHESAWSCDTFTACTSSTGTGGSGGGVSRVAAEPAYQSANLSSALNSRGARLVPDIAVDADPATGFRITTSDPDYGPTVTVGGTSLASPVSAALFVNMLSAYGETHGVGDIHAALYGAEKTAGAFRDVTSGANGAAADDTATRGYDMVTGLGAPLWPALAPAVLHLPTATAHLSLPHLRSSTSTRQVRVSWAGTSATSATVTVSRLGGGQVLHRAPTTTSGATSFTGASGATYRLTVTERTSDARATARARIVVPADDRSFTLAKGWTRHRSARAIGGSYVTSTRAASRAKVRLTGRRYVLVARTGPTLGKVSVAVAGRHVRTVDLHAATPGFRRVRVWGGTGAPLAARTISLTPVSARPIGLDALFAYR